MEAGDVALVSGFALASAAIATVALNWWEARRRERRERLGDERDERDRETALLLDLQEELEGLREHVHRTGPAAEGGIELTIRCRRVRLNVRRLPDEIETAAVRVTYLCEAGPDSGNGATFASELDDALNKAHEHVDARLRQLEGRRDDERGARPRPI